MKSTTWLQALGHAVAAWRRATGLSQLECSLTAGVSQSGLARIEKGDGAHIRVLRLLLKDDLATVIADADTRFKEAAT
jgi:transcriptional regulator with XRE-family HTH domain